MDLYTAPEVASSFQALYENKNGLLDKMMDFWTVVATKMRSNSNVIGYDILNEPWGANLYHDSSLFFHPSKFDRTILYPVHVRAHETIRKVDDEKAIFFEPAQFPDTQPFFGGIPVPVGFPDSPGGTEYRNRQVLNDHTYCCQAAGSICALGEPQLDKSQECRTFHFNKLKQRAADAERYGVPLFYTEFGACFDGEECAVEINNSADAFDS
jgi:endoglycosylceramidase